MICEGAEPAFAREVEVGLQALRLAVDDASLEALAHRQRGEFGGALRPCSAAVSTPSNRSSIAASGS